MKVGVNLINFGPGVSPDSLERWTRLAEALGYHLVMISDHVAVTPDVHERYPAPFYDPFTVLSWLAGSTRTLELGTTVLIVPYRSPLLVARMSANLDRLSGGRLILGIGAGWAEREFRALGIPFDKRGAITDEYMAAVKTLWTNDVASFEGEYVSFQEVYTSPRPLQTPHPPIWVGGSSDVALRRAARIGSGWHPIRFSMQWLKDSGLPRLRRVAETQGVATPALCPRIKVRLTESPLPEDQRHAGDGTLDQARADLAELESLGAEYVLIDTYFDEPEATRSHEAAWRVLTTLAERALDLKHETVR